MPSVPFQYDSLRTVIQYLDPNLRFKLHQRVPSLRSVEKAVPLKINKLEFEGQSRVTVNNTNYRLGVYRHYPGRVPRNHQTTNVYGECFDLDQWGLFDNSRQSTLTPGDVVLPRVVMNYGFDDVELDENEFADEGDFLGLDAEQNSLEREVDFFQKAIAERVEKGEELVEVPETGELPDGMERPIYLNEFINLVFANPEEQKLAEQGQFERLREYSIGCIQRNLQEREDELYPYHCRQNNTQPMFTPMIQLTVTSRRKMEIHRYSYTIKLHEAMKRLCIKLFGARRCAISVNKLDTILCRIIRLPDGLKIRLRQLHVRGSAAIETYEALKPVLDESVCPLEELSVYKGLQNEEEYNHEMVRNAKKFIINHNSSDAPDYLPMILNLRNPTIEAELLVWTLYDQVELIQDWSGRGRPVGSKFQFYTHSREFGDNLMDHIRDNITTATIDDQTATIPMSDNRQLLVTCLEGIRYRYSSQFIATVEVVKAE